MHLTAASRSHFFSNQVCWKLGSFCTSLLEIHAVRFLHKKFIVLFAATVAAVGCLEAALVGKELLGWTTAVTSSAVHKLWNILCAIYLNTAKWKVRKQAAEYSSLARYNLGSLSTTCRSYREPLGWMTNLSHFHAFLDTSKLLLMVAPVADLSLPEANSVILVSTTDNLIVRVACMHLKEQRGL